MSFESDDEELDQELGTGTKQIRYKGEDVSPTSTRELNGWYAYPVAAEVFAVVAVGAYMSLYTQVLSLMLRVSALSPRKSNCCGSLLVELGDLSDFDDTSRFL